MSAGDEAMRWFQNFWRYDSSETSAAYHPHAPTPCMSPALTWRRAAAALPYHCLGLCDPPRDLWPSLPGSILIVKTSDVWTYRFLVWVLILTCVDWIVGPKNVWSRQSVQVSTNHRAYARDFMTQHFLVPNGPNLSPLGLFTNRFPGRDIRDNRSIRALNPFERSSG